MRANTPTPIAPRAATAAIHGASAGFVNGGGLAIASADPVRINAPPTIAAARATTGRRTAKTQSPSDATAAPAANIDQRRSTAHPPANPEPVLNRVHGSSVLSTVTANSTPTARSAIERAGRRRQGPAGAAGVSSPRTSGRHSAPSKRPRTGIAHSMQSGRPHTSHVPTVVRAGWFAHRSPPLTARSSTGMGEAYAPTSACGSRDSVRPMEARVAVLVSGSGTNLQALLDDPAIRPHVVLVLSDRPRVFALERARDAGVEPLVIEPDDFDDRSAFDLAVARALGDRGIDTLVSAGYMRLLGPSVLEVYGGRWLNVHPALLPSFPGMHAVREALAYGVRITGVTVFLVDDGVDTGPIVSQEAVEVLPGDDWDALEARIHDAEHRLLPRAVRALIEGRLEVDGRRVRVREPVDG